MVNCSSSYLRAAALLDPSVPLLAPSMTSEIAAASTSKSATQASHRLSAAATPRRPSTAASSCSWTVTSSRTGGGLVWKRPHVVVARPYLQPPLVGEK